MKIRPITGGASFDRGDFLGELGAGGSEAAARSSLDLYREFAATDYRPEPSYFPGPRWLSAPAQKALVALARKAPRALVVLDRLANATLIRALERHDRSARHPYGDPADIEKGEPSREPPSVHYLGAARQRARQFAWSHDLHIGGEGRPGTIEIAKGLGFSEEQAKRIGVEDFDVDLDATDYREGGRRRITKSGSGGKNGDLHWHYNRSGPGGEDSRIIAARVHLERAIGLARERFYDAAERELGVGLHSLQDIFAHGQITPITHTVLGGFPDQAELHEKGASDALVATRGYLRLYLEGLDLEPPPAPRARGPEQRIDGDASPPAQRAVRRAYDRVLPPIRELLEADGVRLFVAAPGTRATELGFGADLDGDGVIEPGKWVDVDGNGRKDWWEVEDGRPGAVPWGAVPAAYDDRRRTIYISEQVALSGDLQRILDHEIRHAISGALSRTQSERGDWERYLRRAYDAAVRAGRVSPDGPGPEEWFAGRGAADVERSETQRGSTRGRKPPSGGAP